MSPKAIVPDGSQVLAENTKASGQDAATAQKQLDDAIDSAFSGGQAQERANQARRLAAEAEGARERARLEQEADDHEKEARKQLKASQRLQSGAWQGAGAGGAVGAGTGIALGGVVGTLTGGVLAVPLTAVGGLIGAGTGMIHGPWIKLTRGERGPQFEAAQEGEPGAIQLKPDELEAMKNGLEKSVNGEREALSKYEKGLIRNKPKSGRKPPRKLQTRQQGKS